MRESELERIFINEVRREGGNAFKWVSPGNAGVPDRIVMFPDGEIYFVELKAEGGTVRPIQKEQIGRLQKMGQEAGVIKGRKGAILFFESIGRMAAAERLRARFDMTQREGGSD